MRMVCFFFFKHKTAYDLRISDWSSDVCSSDLRSPGRAGCRPAPAPAGRGSGRRRSARRARRDRPGNANGGCCEACRARKSVVQGKSGSVRVEVGGRRGIKKKKSRPPDDINKTDDGMLRTGVLHKQRKQV